MQPKLSRIALRTSLLYAVVAGLWIFASGTVLHEMVSDPVLEGKIEIYKGWAFVLVTAWLLYFELRRQLRRLETEAASRQQAEAAMRLSQFTVDRGEDAIFWVGPTAQILFVNAAACRLLGYSRKELLGKTVPDIDASFPPEKWPAHWAELKQRGSFTFETETRTKDGRLIQTEITVNYLQFDGKEYNCASMRDITERKRVADANVQSLALLRATLESTTDGILTIGADNRILSFNETFAKMWRIPTEVLATKNDQLALQCVLAQLQTPERFLAKVRYLYDHPLAESVDVLDFKDGRVFERFSRPMLVAGQPIGRVWSFRDITERTQAETALQLSDFSVNHASLPTFWIARTARIVRTNHAACALLGYTEAELLQLAITDLDPDFTAAVWPVHWQELRERKHMCFETRQRHKNGQVVPVEVDLNWFEFGGQEYNFAFIRDITERKRAETLADGQRQVLEMIAGDAPLRDTLEALLRVIETQADEMICSILLLDADGRHLRHGAAPRLPAAYVKAIDGVAIGASVGSCGTAAFRRKQVIVEDIATDPLWENYKAVALPHGLRACWSTPIFDAQQKVLGTFAIYYRRPGLPGEQHLQLIDLATHTAAIAIGRQRAKAALLESESQFRQVQKMEGIGQLAGGVAHDFNNILSVIQGHCSLLALDGNLTGDLQESLAEIQLSVARAASLTRQLLAFSRRQSLQMRELNLNEAIANIAKMLQRILGEDISLEFTGAPQPLPVRADPGMLDQVLLNLAVNSRDAMPTGGRLSIQTSSVNFDEAVAGKNPQVRPGAFVCLRVEDSGSGIAPEHLSRIFEPFFTTKEIGKGTGLGLATIYGIVQQHQGWIQVESEVGRGTTFHIYFPAMPESAALVPASPLAAHYPSGAETLLVVEDETAVRNLICRLLQRLGYTVLSAENGVAALALWQPQRDQIKLVLTDIIMPGGLNGFDLASRMLALKPDQKIIFTSGHTGNLEGRTPLIEGDNFIHKPFKSEALAETIRKKLDATMRQEGD